MALCKNACCHVTFKFTKYIKLYTKFDNYIFVVLEEVLDIRQGSFLHYSKESQLLKVCVLSFIVENDPPLLNKLG